MRYYGTKIDTADLSEKLNDDLKTWIDDEWVNYLLSCDEFLVHPFSAEFKIIDNSLCVEMYYHTDADWFDDTNERLSLYFNQDDFSKEVNDKLATLKNFDCDEERCYEELTYSFNYEDGKIKTLIEISYIQESITHLFDEGNIKELESMIESKIFEFGEEFGRSNDEIVSLDVYCEHDNLSLTSVNIQKRGVFKISEIEERLD